MTSTDTGTDLAALRARLDRIDEQLLTLVARRLSTCVEIAHYKRDHDIPMMQPGRIATVHERARAFAADTGLSADFLRRIYDEIIAEACRVEDEEMGVPR